MTFSYEDPFSISPPLTHEQLRHAVTKHRARLLTLGFEPVAILSGQKRPVLNDWQNALMNIRVVSTWAEQYPSALSTGVRTRTAPGIDIDVLDPRVADELEAELLKLLPTDSTILKRVGLSPKRLIPCRCIEPFAKIATAIFQSPDGKNNKVEILGNGQQFVVQGIHPDTHRPYEWLDGASLLSIERERLPLIDEALAKRIIAKAAEVMRRAGWVEQGKDNDASRPLGNGKGKKNDGSKPGKEYVHFALKDEVDAVARAPKGERNPRLNTAGFNLGQLVARGDLDETVVVERLFTAAEACGLVADDGRAAVLKTIRSGIKGGGKKPRQAPQNGNDEEEDNLNTVIAADVEMCGVEWLWPGRFARGKFGLIAGLPDYGKGQIAAFVAAAVTARIDLPCDEGTAPQGNVLWFNAEDGTKDTILPRLVAAEADTKKIHIVNSARICGEDHFFNLATDLRALRNAIKRIGNVVLVIIDPMSAYLGVGKVDGRSATDVRGVLTPLKDMAEELHLAVIGIAHFNKKDDIKSALLRVSDSIAYVAAARHVYVVVDDPEDKDCKLFVKAKNNLARDTKALRYGIGSKKVGHDPKLGVDINAPYIVWHPQHVEITANEAMQNAVSHTAKREAIELLRTRLEAGPVKAEDIIEEAKQEGIAKRTLDRAKKEIGVKSKRQGGLGSEGIWFWELPKKPAREGGQS